MANAHNGHAALPPELLEPSPTDMPIETTIGMAVADATTMLCRTVEEYITSGITEAVQNAGTEQIARVAELQLAHGDDRAFSAIAHREAKRVLRPYLNGDFYQRYSLDEGEAALDLFIGDVLTIVSRVVAVERRWQTDHADLPARA
jgi:hypothetical protein